MRDSITGQIITAVNDARGLSADRFTRHCVVAIEGQLYGRVGSQVGPGESNYCVDGSSEEPK